DLFPGAGSQTGIGDVVQSLFFSPVEPVNGWVLGGGPVFLLPTGTDDLLTGDKWGAGPTAVALKQSGHLTYGLLTNHIWSFAGPSGRSDISTTFLQPFFSYTTPTAWTFTLQTESTYDWEKSEWAIPINTMLTKVVSIGSQKLQIGGGLRYWAASAKAGPEGLGFRAFVTLLFPKG
ncbi:MAG: transporter, partial [Deltaproteobacteria bacterium]|nr:transporter [Deltaproteobacteria bacterium]